MKCVSVSRSQAIWRLRDRGNISFPLPNHTTRASSRQAFTSTNHTSHDVFKREKFPDVHEHTTDDKNISETAIGATRLTADKTLDFFLMCNNARRERSGIFTHSFQLCRNVYMKKANGSFVISQNEKSLTYCRSDVSMGDTLLWMCVACVSSSSKQNLFTNMQFYVDDDDTNDNKCGDSILHANIFRLRIWRK